jgi:hypothetical protein
MSCAHDVPALAEDDLPLVVHHVVKFQQLLANVEIAAFDLRLRTALSDLLTGERLLPPLSCQACSIFVEGRSDPKMRIRSSSSDRKEKLDLGSPWRRNSHATGCRCGGFRGVRLPKHKGHRRPSQLASLTA